MQVYLPEDEPAAELHPVEDAEDKERSGNPRRKSPYGMIRIGADGGMLMPYEILINPEAVVSKPLHFPWKEVKRELDKLEALGKEYAGRRLYMMYNPVTGRTNGITPNFFATMTIRPPKIVDRPHRHVSAAINYYFHGKGYSTVAGNRYEWAAGDLMLSAPGWAVHNHASYDDYVYELTVQDQPLNLFMESLLWQEEAGGTPRERTGFRDESRQGGGIGAGDPAFGRGPQGPQGHQALRGRPARRGRVPRAPRFVRRP
jgi:gentisate 1,2-dioxygenase